MLWLIYVMITSVAVDCQYVHYNGNLDNNVSPCSDVNHLFLTPGVLAAGGSNRMCLSRFYPDGAARLIITLVTENRQIVTESRDLIAGDGGCLDLIVPLMPNTKANITVNVRYPEAQCVWERRITTRIGSGRVVVIHTERARYRPGETVRARVLALKADLTPGHGVIDEIWLEGPRGTWEGARAEQWTRVRSKLGLAQVQHDLDEQAPPGKWTIRAKLADGSQGSAAFTVGTYNVPPFQLSVRHARRVLRTSDRLTWTVCVRYPWTEAVEGMLVIRLRGIGGSTGGESAGSGGVRTAVRLHAPRACHRHAAAARRVGLSDTNPPEVIIADFSFQEDGTRTWQNTTVVSQVVDNRVFLEFMSKHRAVIAPGLPHKLKIKAIRWDDKPAVNEKLKVCRSGTQLAYDVNDDNTNASKQLEEKCGYTITNDEGIAAIMFTAGDNYSNFYRFQTSLQNDSTVTSLPLFLPVKRTGRTQAALGPLRVDPHATRSFVSLYLNSTEINTALTVHFVVITRGGIIYRWGATTQCPIAGSVNQVQTASRNSPCYAQVPRLDSNLYKLDSAMPLDSNASDSLLDRHLLRVMLPIKVTHQMCPDSHLIAYFYYNGEFISASKHFDMEECLANKVEASWQSRQISPGSLATLKLETPGPALCALTVLDTATRQAPPTQIVKESLMTNLKRLIDSHRNVTQYDATGDCFLSINNPEDLIPSSNIELIAMLMASAGVRTLGGNISIKRFCPKEPALLMSDDVTMPRSDFSEAWLWRVVTVGGNGSARVSARGPHSVSRFEASAMCISAAGLALSSPAPLQVFREFFIHADSPKTLKRGESMVLRYRIFNYLYEPLSVQIQIQASENLEIPAQYVEAACLKARSSTARRVAGSARSGGLGGMVEAKLVLRARAVHDRACNATAHYSNVSDEVIINIQVEPEGVPIHDHQSMLLCGIGSAESFVSSIMWKWPKVDAVPGTETLTVRATADSNEPWLADADNLVLLPRGCGEQNMARLATNLLALKQLDPQSLAAMTAKEHVTRGFARQFQYLHPSGGFSAFGRSDPSPSTWLTAFTVKYLRRAHEMLSPGQAVPAPLRRAEQWLLDQQMENGCFRNEGQVFHRELKGALNEAGEIANVALTAYVTISLIESSIILPARVVRNTLSCLRAFPMKSKSPNRIYAQALLAYAFMKLKSYEDELRKTNDASLIRNNNGNIEDLNADEETVQLMELMKMAKRSSGFVWWETGSLSSSIEATSYAVLALAQCPRDARCADEGRAALSWLSTHRNAAGGFVSTQDTLVALEAIISWSAIYPPSPTNLTLTAISSGILKTTTLQSRTRITDVMKLPIGYQLKVAVEGAGCALVQATRSYNSAKSDTLTNKQMSVQVSVHTEGPFECDRNQTFCFCAAVVEACVVWWGVFPTMALMEARAPSGFAADPGLLYVHLHHNDTLLRRIELSGSNNKVTLYLAARDSTSDGGGHSCYSIHMVGPRARTKPAYVTLLDYYRPEINDTQMYTIPEDCPPRISHENNDYSPSHNLYNKARSVENSDEIIITDEYSYDDIPEGIIPLEDPLYDNIIQEHEKSNILLNNTINKVYDSKAKASNLVESQTEKPEKVVRIRETKSREVNIEDIVMTRKKVESLIPSNNDDTFTGSIKSAEYIKIKSSNETISKNNNITENESNSSQTGDIKNKTVENPNLSNFHLIDTETDLETPSGIEGPVPAYALPPPNFVPAVHHPQNFVDISRIESQMIYRPYPTYSYRRTSRPYKGRDRKHFRTANRRYSYLYQPTPLYYIGA